MIFADSFAEAMLRWNCRYGFPITYGAAFAIGVVLEFLTIILATFVFVRVTA